MPNPPVDPNDIGLLECGCREDEALVEAIYVELGFIGEEVAKQKAGYGWKTLGRPERERLLRISEMMGLGGLDGLLELI